MILDDLAALRAIDRSGMLTQMDKIPGRFWLAADANVTCPTLLKPQNVIFGGVGGSGIVGEIVADSFREVLDVPIAVCRTLKVPRYVGPQTLFVMISYSGETIETLGLMEQASARGAVIAVISSGGRLLSESASRGIPHLKVPHGMPPRVALPELLSATIHLLEKASLIDDADRLLSEASGVLKRLIEDLRATSPSNTNPAKQIAVKLQNRLPLLIGSEDSVSVLRRFKNELNENSKMPAFLYALPEGYHDDVEGLRALRELVQTQPIFLQIDKESDNLARARDRLVALLDEFGFPPSVTVEGIGKHKLSRLLSAVTTGGYVSVYLAALRGIDPTELSVIPIFRKIMRSENSGSTGPV